MHKRETNVPAYLSIMWLFLAGLTAFIMYQYPDYKNFPWHSYPTIFIQYFCAFGIILLVPLDVSVTVMGRNLSTGHEYYNNNINTIIDMYLSLYWPTIILSNVVLVFEEIYNGSGYFDVKSKLKDILIQTSYQALVGVVAGSILFGVLIGEHVIQASMDAVLLTAVVITNTFGLTFLMFLLGY